MPPDILVSLIGIAGIATALISLLVLRLTLTRRLKKKLQATDDYWDSGTLDFGFLNTYVFAYACTLPFASRSANFKAIYKDLDVKVFATLFEKCTAYAMTGGFVVFFISIPIFYLIK